MAAPTDNAGIRPGAERIDLQEGNSHGVLLLHGFGDTPQTLRLLAESIHEAGYDVVAPLLPGHGRTVDAFARSRRSEWLSTAREELAKLRATHQKVSVGGLSMGGALTAILASETRGLTSIVMMAPYLDMPSHMKALSASHWLWGRVLGVRKSRNPGSILDDAERAKNLGYGVYSGRLIYELWRIATKARRGLSKINTPTLLLQSRTDSRVASAIAENAFAVIGSKEKKLVWIEGAGHIITVDYGRERVFDEVQSWLAAHPA
jgi:carboxylesterase